MNKFYLLLAVVFASSLAFMNCGPAGKCSPTNCGGCCDASGTCVTATSATACGKQGETCNTCTAPTNVCIAGACASGTTGGGGGTTGGGGGTTGGGGGTTGGGTGGGTGGCMAIDFSQAQSVGAEYNAAAGMNPANHQGLVFQPSAVTGKFDFIGFESWYFGPNATPTFPQTVPVPSPAGTTYSDCADCIWLDEACDTNGGNCARSYFAEAGGLTITTATRNVTRGTFNATATNLSFTEWDFSQNGDVPVPNGRCATVATVTVNSTWDNTPDAGMDAGFDAGVEDAGFDAGVEDAGFDAGVEDAGFDAGVEDAGFDAGP